MNRQEATGVLREVIYGCRDYVDLNFISITDSTAQTRMNSTGYEIYIKCAPNENIGECLSPILAKHQLKMAELENAIVIYNPK